MRERERIGRVALDKMMHNVHRDARANLFKFSAFQVPSACSLTDEGISDSDPCYSESWPTTVESVHR